ncbi:hypothetical protein FPV67DRAFT_1460825 [Lyophyllum atratum]|nr:hypothetical protein FPV67DRAFT_1460825 [Lyophyllum atratum]
MNHKLLTSETSYFWHYLTSQRNFRGSHTQSKANYRRVQSSSRNRYLLNFSADRAAIANSTSEGTGKPPLRTEGEENDNECTHAVRKQKIGGTTVPDPISADQRRPDSASSNATVAYSSWMPLKQNMVGWRSPPRRVNLPQVGGNEDGANGVSHRELVRSTVAALLTESEDSHFAQMALGDYAPITHVAQLSDRFYIDRCFRTLAPEVVQNLDPRDDPDDGNGLRPSEYADVCDYHRLEPPVVEASASTERLYWFRLITRPTLAKSLKYMSDPDGCITATTVAKCCLSLLIVGKSGETGQEMSAMTTWNFLGRLGGRHGTAGGLKGDYWRTLNEAQRSDAMIQPNETALLEIQICCNSRRSLRLGSREVHQNPALVEKVKTNELGPGWRGGNGGLRKLDRRYTLDEKHQEAEEHSWCEDDTSGSSTKAVAVGRVTVGRNGIRGQTADEIGMDGTELHSYLPTGLDEACRDPVPWTAAPRRQEHPSAFTIVWTDCMGNKLKIYLSLNTPARHRHGRAGTRTRWVNLRAVTYPANGVTLQNPVSNSRGRLVKRAGRDCDLVGHDWTWTGLGGLLYDAFAGAGATTTNTKKISSVIDEVQHHIIAFLAILGASFANEVDRTIDAVRQLLSETGYQASVKDTWVEKRRRPRWRTICDEVCDEGSGHGDGGIVQVSSWMEIQWLELGFGGEAEGDRSHDTIVEALRSIDNRVISVNLYGGSEDEKQEEELASVLHITCDSSSGRQNSFVPCVRPMPSLFRMLADAEILKKTFNVKLLLSYYAERLYM